MLTPNLSGRLIDIDRQVEWIPTSSYSPLPAPPVETVTGTRHCTRLVSYCCTASAGPLLCQNTPSILCRIDVHTDESSTWLLLPPLHQVTGNHLSAGYVLLAYFLFCLKTNLSKINERPWNAQIRQQHLYIKWRCLFMVNRDQQSIKLRTIWLQEPFCRELHCEYRPKGKRTIREVKFVKDTEEK